MSLPLLALISVRLPPSGYCAHHRRNPHQGRAWCSASSPTLTTSVPAPLILLSRYSSPVLPSRAWVLACGAPLRIQHRGQRSNSVVQVRHRGVCLSDLKVRARWFGSQPLPAGLWIGTQCTGLTTCTEPKNETRARANTMGPARLSSPVHS